MGLTLSLGLSAGSPEAGAVVGQAERYDEVAEADLEEFHQNLLSEERQKQLAETEEISGLLDEKAADLGEEKAALDEEIVEMRKALLNLPERDLLRFETVGRYTYDTNVNRKVPRQEKGDSIFDAGQTIRLDLSGKKTQFQFDTRLDRQWNVEFSTKDYWSIEERLRYRRRYFKKVRHSAQSMVRRHNSKTIELDDNKIRWDIRHNSSFNYPVTEKLEFNGTFDWNKRVFTQEAFDQDSAWQVVFASDAFWNFTPKSRAALGYRFGANRIRTKTGDTNDHEISAGYFGKLTRKSSVSADIAFGFQNPRSRDTASVRTVTVGAGHIWQLTPKTQLTTQVIRSLQNSSSDLVSGVVDGVNTTSKQDTHFTHDSISLALNSRLSKKLTGKISFTPSHLRTTVEEGGNRESEARQFTFPVTVEMDYVMRRWIRLALSYTFTFRTGDEKSDTFRTHIWRALMRLAF